MMSRDGRVLAGPFRLLGTANARVAGKHGNPACDPLLPFGHPPAGTYVVAGSLPPSFTHPRRPRRFGALGALLLQAVAGPAFASVANGRALIVLHGGPVDDAGRLRCTRGGLRVTDADMLALMRALNAAQEALDPVASVEVIEAADVDIDSVPSMDLRGARRALGAPALQPRGGVDLSRHAMFLVALGAGANRGPRAKSRLDRRAFVQSALWLVGGLTMGACSQSSPRPPPLADPNCDGASDCRFTPGGAGGGGGGGGTAGCTPDDAGAVPPNCPPPGGYATGGGTG